MTPVRIFHIFLMALLPITFLRAQETGKIIERITCDLNKDYSYSLYLPSTYTPEKKWPVIIVYNATGDGLTSVRKFQKAAEKYGYIVIGSYNYRNGPLQPAFEAAEVVFEEIPKKYSIDENRYYTAGMSGGARMANTIAVISDQISGVISIAAGFNGMYAPSKTNKYNYVGIVGDKDMNYLEMLQVEKLLTDMGYNNQLITYDGKHRWCEEDEIVRAVSWLEFYAMKEGQLSPDNGFVSELLNVEKEEALALSEEGDLAEAEARLQRMQRSSEWLDQHDFKAEIERIKQSEDYKKVDRLVKKARDQEATDQKTFNNAFRNIAQINESAENKKWWKSRISSLKYQEKTSKSPESRKVATRLLGYVGLFAFSTGSGYSSAGNFQDALPYFEVSALLGEKDPYVRYYMAKLYALTDQKNKALRTLKEAKKLGYEMEVPDGKEAFTQLLDKQEFGWLMWRVINATF